MRVFFAVLLALQFSLCVASEPPEGYGATFGELIEAYDPSVPSEPLLPPVSDEAAVRDEVEIQSVGYDLAPQESSWMEQPDDSLLDWLDAVKVGYDRGFLIASRRALDLQSGQFPFQLKLNGWGQLRQTKLNVDRPNRDLNQFQLKRGRLVFSGSAFTPDFDYFIQLDGRSSSGDDVRLLDYFLGYDIGRHFWNMEPNRFGFRTGKYKMPFNRARWMTGREFEFTDRSMSSMFFDVNRSFAAGVFGGNEYFGVPFDWELAVFNGLVTGGAETGSAGTLDANFAYSGRLSMDLHGEWGSSELADFEWHRCFAMRVGAGFAASDVDRSGSTEFSSIRVVDSGERLSDLLPLAVRGYSVSLYSVDASVKYRGWSSTFEYYFRNVNRFEGGPAIASLFDHGMWYQLGWFVIPNELQLLTRWSRVQGNSRTLGERYESSREISVGVARYFRENHFKLVVDATSVNGATINSSALDLSPGDNGWLFRSQIQFSF